MITSPKQISSKSALSDWVTIALCAAMLLLLALSGQSFSQCSIDSAAWLYTHPYFEGKEWKAASNDSLDQALDPSVCQSQPAFVEMAPLRNASTACVVADAAGNLQYWQIDLTAPQCACCRTLLTIGAVPATLPAAIPAGGAVRIVRQAGGIGDTMLLAATTVGRRVLVRSIRLSNLSLVKTDTLALSTPPNAFSVPGVWGAVNQTSGADTGVWITGTAGVIRYFALKGAAWGAEQLFDLVSGENVTAMGPDIIGTATGSVYTINGTRSAFSLASRPCSTAIRSISTTALAADSGRIAVKIGAAWHGYRSGSTNFSRIHLSKFAAGSGAELLDSRWHYTSMVYANTATSIGNVVPGSVKIHLNSNPYAYTAAKPETVTVVLADIDSNFLVPSVVETRPGFAGTTTLLSSGLLRNTDPAAPCSVSARYFTDSAVSVILRPDSAIVTSHTAAGAFDFSCYSCFWQRQIYRTGVAWPLDTGLIMVAVGADTLKIVRSRQSTTAVSSPAHQENDDIAVRLIDGRVRLELSLQLASSARTIRIVSPNGRILAVRDARNPDALDFARGAGFFYLQIVMIDGRTLVRALPVVR